MSNVFLQHVFLVLRKQARGTESFDIVIVHFEIAVQRRAGYYLNVLVNFNTHVFLHATSAINVITVLQLNTMQSPVFLEAYVTSVKIVVKLLLMLLSGVVRIRCMKETSRESCMPRKLKKLFCKKSSHRNRISLH